MSLRKFSPRVRRQIRCLTLAAVWMAGSAALVAHGMIFPRSVEEQDLAALARVYKRALGIQADIPVVIVKKNERLASVRPAPGRSATYLLEIDEGFLATLSDEEKHAVIAHEVGHVWIFTHHPHQQSEALANEKAEGLVNVRSLVNLYKKVWALGGQPGTVAEFLTQKLGAYESEDSSSATGIPALQSELPAEPASESSTQQQDQ